MSDRSNQPVPTPAALEAKSNAKEKDGANDPELEAESEAIDTAISSGLFLAPRQELLKTEAELKKETEEGSAKPKKI